MPESLRDRLKALGVKTGISSTDPIKVERKFPIGEVLTGDEIHNSFGTVFQHQDDYPIGYLQGNTNLDQPIGLEIFARWARTLNLENLQSDSLLFLDTETTGLSGGTGTYVFLAGMGYQTSQGFTVKQFFLQDPAEEAAFLTALSEAISDFKGIVTYNGKSFDIPILKTRFILNGLTPPFSPLGHIDLLHLARRLWKYRLAQRNLGILETEILEMARSSDEIPGWMIPEMYIDYIRSGDARPLKGVFYHNAMDIVSLAAVMVRISRMISDGDHSDEFEGSEIMAAGELHQTLGRNTEAESFFITAAEKPMEKYHLLLNRRKMAEMYRKSANWDKAIPILVELAENGLWEACCDLAKYYEHTARDFNQAVRYSQMGIVIVQKAEITNSIREAAQADFNRRMERLVKKANRNAKS
jgi:uncharacterized protein YprB with RNaseH-like and TPR domain